MREFLCSDGMVWILFGGGYMNLDEGSNCIELHPSPPQHVGVGIKTGEY